MDRYSADDRELFEAAGMALYEELLESGGIVDGDPRIEPGGDLHPAFSQLRTMGLVRQDQSGNTWIVEDPDLVHSRVVSPLSQQGARLLEESTRWAQDFGALSQAWRKAAGRLRARTLHVPARRPGDRRLHQTAMVRRRRRRS